MQKKAKGRNVEPNCIWLEIAKQAKGGEQSAEDRIVERFSCRMHPFGMVVIDWLLQKTKKVPVSMFAG